MVFRLAVFAVSFLCLATHSLAGEPCLGGIPGKIKERLEIALTQTYDFQRDYWSEVRRTHGKRMGKTLWSTLLYQRRDDYRLSPFRLLDYPILPLTLGMRLSKSTISLGVIPTVAANIIAYQLYGNVLAPIDNVLSGGWVSQRGLPATWDDVREKAKKVINGQRALEIAQASGLSPGATMSALRDYSEKLEYWWHHPAEVKKLPRLAELKSLGAIGSEKEATALNAIAAQAYYEAACPGGSCVQEVPGDFSERVTRRYIELLTADPLLGKKSSRDLQLLSAVFRPELKISGKTDLEVISELFGLAPENDTDPLRGVAEEVRLFGINDTILVHAFLVIRNPALIRARSDLWRNKIGGEPPKFFLRPGNNRFDQPLSADIGGTNPGTVVLNDEISRWKMIWEDPRFKNFKIIAQKGLPNQALNPTRYTRLPSDAILTSFEHEVQAYNELYQLQRRSPKPSHKVLCDFLGITPDAKANPILKQTTDAELGFSDRLHQLDDSQKISCEIALGEIAWRFLRDDRLYQRGEEQKEFLDRLDQDAEHAAADCPIHSRRCDETDE